MSFFFVLCFFVHLFFFWFDGGWSGEGLGWLVWVGSVGLVDCVD